MKELLIKTKSLSPAELVDFIRTEEVSSDSTHRNIYLSLLKQTLHMIELSNEFNINESKNSDYEDEMYERLINEVNQYQVIFDSLIDKSEVIKENILEAFLFLQTILRPADAFYFDDHLYRHVAKRILSNDRFIKVVKLKDLEPFIMEIYDEVTLSKDNFIYPYSYMRGLVISNEMLDHIISYTRPRNSNIHNDLVEKLLNHKIDADFLIETLKDSEQNGDYKKACYCFRLLNNADVVKEYQVPTYSDLDYRTEYELLRNVDRGEYSLDDKVNIYPIEALEEAYLNSELTFNYWNDRLYELINSIFERAYTSNWRFSDYEVYYPRLHRLISLSNPDVEVPDFKFNFDTGKFAVKMLEIYYRKESFYDYFIKENDYHLFDKVFKKHKKLFTKEEKASYRELIKNLPNNKNQYGIEDILHVLMNRSEFEFAAMLDNLYDKNSNCTLNKMVAFFRKLNLLKSSSNVVNKFDCSLSVIDSLDRDWNYIEFVKSTRYAFDYIDNVNPMYNRYVVEFFLKSIYSYLENEVRIDFFVRNSNIPFNKLLTFYDRAYLSGRFDKELTLII